jgi:hypothetical protein
MKPLTPSSTRSFAPTFALTITGRRDAIASRTTIPKVSNAESIMNRSEAR